MDDEGWLRIVGRIRDVIIRGGEKIAASEVESALEAHPAVHQAVAVGYPDELMGERVAAFVVTDGPFDLEACRAGSPSGDWLASRPPSGWSGWIGSRCSAQASPTGPPCDTGPPRGERARPVAPSGR